MGQSCPVIPDRIVGFTIARQDCQNYQFVVNCGELTAVKAMCPDLPDKSVGPTFA